MGSPTDRVSTRCHRPASCLHFPSRPVSGRDSPETLGTSLRCTPCTPSRGRPLARWNLPYQHRVAAAAPGLPSSHASASYPHPHAGPCGWPPSRAVPWSRSAPAHGSRSRRPAAARHTPDRVPAAAPPFMGSARAAHVTCGRGAPSARPPTHKGPPSFLLSPTNTSPYHRT